jgi:hypothetical protein
MQKWEYAFVALKALGDENFQFTINGSPAADARGEQQANARYWQLANKLGGEGWELVIHDGVQLVFKRPRE